jgi:alkanesulfonate monooxygenase SsuD/methylene tetrahydromethanopterin reductase-like flavin-dependent oxidoreductase (luciferase family)
MAPLMTAIGACDVGLLLPTREAVLFHGADAGVVLDSACRAEELGFASVWVGDSLTARPRFEPMTLLGAVAAVTRSVRVGTAILLPAMRHPALLAHQIATVDRIAKGRLVVGVGAGADLPATQQELALVGVGLHERIGRMYAALRVWRALWRGDPAPATRYWPIEGLRLDPLPSQAAGPPVWVGGDGPQTLRRTGEQFDGWLPFSPTVDAYAAGLNAVQNAAIAAGRPDRVTAAMYATVTIDDDPAEAVAAQSAYMEAYYDTPYHLMKVFQCCIAGTADQVVTRLRRYVDAGVTHLIVRPGTASTSTARSRGWPTPLARAPDRRGARVRAPEPTVNRHDHRQPVAATIPGGPGRAIAP